mgnify:CR=1 FL=1
MSKIDKFLNMNKYERKLSICRNLYYIIHQKKFCQIGHKSYILKPIFLSGTKYISIGDQSGIWHHARIEVLDKWIEATRIKLKKNLLIKHDKESMNEQLYSGMHNIFGPEIMGVLDDINSKGQE